MTRYEKQIIPQDVLNWREGDPIENKHRKAVAAHIANTLHLSKEKEEEALREYEQLPDQTIAEAVAVMIASLSKMSLDMFFLSFPKIAASNSLAVTQFISANFPDSPDSVSH